MDPFDLTGRVAVVTGGGTGIGRATALLFAEHGADVVVASRKLENLEKAAASILERGRRALAVRTDVRVPDDLRCLVDTTLAELGRIDILVNNAGGSYARPLSGWDLDAWQNMIDLNLRSVFVLSRLVAPRMIERGGGVIVNVSSGAATAALPDVAPYGAAKAGVNNLTAAMAAEWGPQGVRVNCVQVGAVKSEGFLRAMARAGRDPDEIGGLNALGRAGDPGEIAWPILFLASPASSFMTGQTIVVNGGPRSPSLS